MIVVCPNCGAKYRLSEAVLSRRARLRCAECEHRWLPEGPDAAPIVPPLGPARPITEADEEAAFAAVQAQMQSRWQPAPEAAAPAPGEPGAPATADSKAGDTDADTDTDLARDGRGGEFMRWLVAGIFGIALFVAAAGLWLGQTDPTAVPYVGPLLERLQSPSPLRLVVAGQTTLLASRRRVLEITGSVRNESRRVVQMPPLRASLAGPAGVAVRWTMAPPVLKLLPGQQVEFSGTITGFPADATLLTMRAGR